MDNNFESNSPAVVADNGGMALATREQAEIQAAVVSAKRFPRNESACYAKVMKSFERPVLAESALYSFPRGGKSVEGPSVQCAREIARIWGNIRYGLKVLSSDATQVHLKGFAYDIETNNLIEAEHRLEKKIQRKNRSTGVTEWVQPDERDLRELINKHGAVLVRNCILQLVPPDVVEDACKTAKATVAKAAKEELVTNREDTIRRLVMAFDTQGVSAEMIERKLGHELALVTETEIAELKAVWKSLNDGNSSRQEHFEFKKTESAVSDLNEVITDKKKRAT